jgi:hypothetical protein
MGYKHKEESLEKMREIKRGENNPMYGKPKSPEFLAMQTRDITGPNNPQYGKRGGRLKKH